MIRSFFAIKIPEEYKEELLRIMDALRQTGADVKLTRPENVHLTLKFLGDIQESMAPKLAGAVRDMTAGQKPFCLRTQGMGVFPGTSRPRVIWLGLADDADGLNTLYKSVQNAAESLGFSKDDRAFKPHLTLGRVRSAKGKEALLTELKKLDPKPLEFKASEIILFQSVLKPSGAVYTPLERIALLDRI